MTEDEMIGWHHGLNGHQFEQTLGAWSNSCPPSRWYHPTISSSVIPFSSCLQSFPASGSFPVSQLFTLGGQSTEASASASVLPMNIKRLISFRIEWFGFLAVQGTLKSLLQHHSSKASILWCHPTISSPVIPFSSCPHSFPA